MSAYRTVVLTLAFLLLFHINEAENITAVLTSDDRTGVLRATLATHRILDVADALPILTVFAPTNGAFAQTLEDLGATNVNADNLTSIVSQYQALEEAAVFNLSAVLAYHATASNVSVASLMDGNPINTLLPEYNFQYDDVSSSIADGDPNIVNAKVLNTTKTDNGYVHFIDRLLIFAPINTTLSAEILGAIEPPSLTLAPNATAAEEATTETPTDTSTGPVEDSTHDFPTIGHATPEKSNSTKGSGACFPASAKVHTSDGSTMKMQDITAGVSVRVSSGQHYSPIFLFSHRQHTGIHEFVRLSTSSGHSISLSPNHYIYANEVLVIARSVRVGDTLRTIGGKSSVVSVESVREKGLFAPHAVHRSDIVVNGIVASSYTSKIHPNIADKLLAPIRMVVRLGLAKEPLGSALYNGADTIAKLIPSGPKRL